METLVSYFSGFIQGNPRNSPTYLPFSTAACRNGLTDRIQKEYENVLREMDAICHTYLDLGDYKIRLLVGGVVDAILADDTFHGRFDVGRQWLDKTELADVSEFILQPFLVTVWSVILAGYPDTTDGAKTYESWTEDAGFNTAREITTEIGVERAKKITVSVELPGEAEQDTAGYEVLEAVVIDQEERKQQTLVSHNGRIYNQNAEKIPAPKVIPTGVEPYMKKLAEKYNCIPTILFKEPLTPFREYYVPNDIKWHEPVPGERNSYCVKTTNGEKITNLLGVSQYLVLSGTGGLGKSMMMRNLLLTSVDEYQKNEKIPFFVPLKDYSPSYSMLEYVFTAASNFWPELTAEGLDFILTEGKALLLFDGLDEIHSSLLADFTKKMNDFQDRYSKNSFIISSRPYSNFQSFTRSTVLNLMPLSLTQALNLVDRYNYRADAPNLQARFRFQLEHELFATHTSFCANPLLLSIMLLTFEMDAEVPLEKYLFYQEAYTVLSRRHDALKDGYSRKLETGWNANQFADYFAFFCATSYKDGLVSFTYPQMDQYFHKLVRKYGINDVTLDAFIFDLTNNLCLLYRDGPKYSFIHRSFQEYFCAKYFNAQLDELLVHVIPMFDRDDKTKKGDSAIEMLFDMKPKAVEKYLILPYLNGLIEDCEKKDGIWTFLSRLYDRYEMADGDAWADDDNCKPHSNLYSFILDHYHVPLLSPTPEMFPNIDFYTQETMVYREDTKQDDWKDNLPSGYEECYGEPEETGHLFVIRWSVVHQDYQRCPWLLEGFIPAVEDPNSPFMAEYSAVKKLTRELEMKVAERPPAADFFDLME